MTLGERLVQLRNRAGLSQDALAEQLGVSRQSVSKWETDTSVPDLDKLVRLSEVFDVSLDELVKGEAPASAAPQAAGTAAARLTALYREKFYLLGWVLAGWGIWGLLRSAWAVATIYLPVFGLKSALDFFFLLSFHLHVENLLKMLLGALVVLRGKRLSGQFRWYHVGWALLLVGLFGIPRLRCLRSGPLSILFTFLFLIIPQQGTEDLLADLAACLLDGTGCLLLCVLGVFLLVYGKRSYAKERSAE